MRMLLSFQRPSRLLAVRKVIPSAIARLGLAPVVIADIYSSGTTPIPGVTSKLIVDAVLDAHPSTRIVWLPHREDLISFIAGEAGPGDVCISMGCGDIATLPDEVLARRAARRMG